MVKKESGSAVRKSKKRKRRSGIQRDHGPHPFRVYRPDRLALLFDVDPSTIWRWYKTGVLPEPVRIGGIHGWTHEQIKSVIPSQTEGE
jgi:predicted DNA-binding transcriptional regulator AlpA